MKGSCRSVVFYPEVKMLTFHWTEDGRWGTAALEITLVVQQSISPALSQCLTLSTIPMPGGEWYNMIFCCMIELDCFGLQSCGRWGAA